jgi:hypothetical protein
LPESIKRGGGKSLSLTGKASGPPAESGNDAPGKRGEAMSGFNGSPAFCLTCGGKNVGRLQRWERPVSDMGENHVLHASDYAHKNLRYLYANRD